MPTVAELRSQAAELRKLAATLEQAAEGLAKLGGIGNGNSELLIPTRNRDYSRLSGLEAIYRALSEAAGPVTKAELAQFLGTHGKAIGDNTLMSYLSRDPRFESKGRGLWGLTKPVIEIDDPPSDLGEPIRKRTRTPG